MYSRWRCCSRECRLYLDVGRSVGGRGRDEELSWSSGSEKEGVFDWAHWGEHG